jgi:arginyl-tRNA synthetase
MSVLDLKQHLLDKTGKVFDISQKQELSVLSVFDRENSIPLDSNENYIVSKTGPYINIDLSVTSFNTFLQTPYGLPKLTQNQGVYWLEYFSPNVAKQLHIGHVRNVNTGVALENLLRLKYPNLVTDSHIGDWGVQFGVLIWAIKKLGTSPSFEVTISDQPIQVSRVLLDIDPSLYYTYLYVWGNQQELNYPEFKQEVRNEFVLLTQGDNTNTALWKSIITVCQDANTTELLLLNMRSPDYTLGESVYEQGVQDLITFLDANQIVESEDKARFIDYTKLSRSELDPEIQSQLKALIGKDGTNELGRGYLVSSTGYSTYLSRDIAARVYWIKTYGIDHALTITDNSQNHALRQVIVACAWLSTIPAFIEQYGNEVARVLQASIRHIGYGRVVLKSGKMSTRKGNFVTAKDVIDATLIEAKSILSEKNPEMDPDVLETNSQAIARAALKWNDLKSAIHQDSTFDLETILNFEGNTGVYQLYTYARLQSILSKNSEYDHTKVSALVLTPIEKELMRKLYVSTQAIVDAVENLEPQKVTNMLFGVAQSINSWYNTTNVTRETDEVRKHTLLALCERASEVLAITNELLGITVVKSL